MKKPRSGSAELEPMFLLRRISLLTLEKEGRNSQVPASQGGINITVTILLAQNTQLAQNDVGIKDASSLNNLNFACNL